MYIYAGIGSRETPKDVLDLMIRMGHGFGQHSWLLRSGGADGADSAFEQGCDKANGPKEIYIPWTGYNKNQSQLTKPTQAALEIAERFHEGWRMCRSPVRLLFGRNCHIILGQELNNPVSCIICYTPKGRGIKPTSKGGTSHSIRVGLHYNIPIFDIGLYYDPTQQPYDMEEHILEHCREFLRTYVIKGA
jgi:hypothetical protein